MESLPFLGESFDRRAARGAVRPRVDLVGEALTRVSEPAEARVVGQQIRPLSAPGRCCRCVPLSRSHPSRTPSTTGGSRDSQRIRVTHPFHPLRGNEYELVGYGHTWGEPRVFFREHGQTRVRSLPANWTDVAGADPFVVLSAGRSHFRVEDLLQLARLLGQLKALCK